MSNSTIQILRSYSNTAPQSLLDGELAYSFVANTLYIGSNTYGIIAISDQATANLARNLANTKVNKSGDNLTGPLYFTVNPSISNLGFGAIQDPSGYTADVFVDQQGVAQLNWSNTNFVYVDGVTASIQSPNVLISAETTGNAKILVTGGATYNAWTFSQDGHLLWPDGTYQNTAFVGYATDNVARDTANASFIQANTPSYVANSASVYANSAFLKANTPSDVANSAASYANAAFAAANTAASEPNALAAWSRICFSPSV